VDTRRRACDEWRKKVEETERVSVVKTLPRFRFRPLRLVRTPDLEKRRRESNWFELPTSEAGRAF